MGPEAFDISSLLGGGDGKEIDFSKIMGDDGQPLGIDTTGLDEGDTFDISKLLGGGDSVDDPETASRKIQDLISAGATTEEANDLVSSGGTGGSTGPAGTGNKIVFDDDKEPGSSGGTGGSTGVAKKDDLGSYKGSTYDDSGGKKTKVDDKGNVILPDGTKVTPGGTVTPPGPTIPPPKTPTTPTTPTKPDGKKRQQYAHDVVGFDGHDEQRWWR